MPTAQKRSQGKLPRFNLTPVVPLERDIQRSILAYLQWEPRVAWAHRFNTGAAVGEGTDHRGRATRHYIRFAFKGCADILGQLRTGEFLAIEVKRPGEKLRPEQAEFLEQVKAAGGLAVCARCIEDIKTAITQHEETKACHDS